jgi:hypothetical protein
MTPRTAFIARMTDPKNAKKLAAYVFDAMQLASTHDPDLVKDIKNLTNDANILFESKHRIQERLDIVERQLERIGAPQYRVKRYRNGATVYVQRVRGVKPGDCKLNVEA